MSDYQRQYIAHAGAYANRLVEIARTSKKKEDEINAGWAMHRVFRVKGEAS